LAFVAAAMLVAQQPSTIHVDVKVVSVLASVRDKHGNIVNTLNKDDFTLEEDGRPQTIRYFTRETDLPLTLGLLVDTSWSQSQVLEQEKTASAAFTNEVLREGKDSAFLIHFDREVELLRDLTSSRQKLYDALQELQAPQYDRQRGGGAPGGGNPGGGSGRGSRGGGSGSGTLLYDSVFLASDELMEKQQGRKAIIVLTDGVDHGSKMSLDGAIESAQRADTMVYSIYFAGEERTDHHGSFSPPWGGGSRGGGWPRRGGGGPGGGGGGGRQGPVADSGVDGKKVLERLSRETGGRMFVVSKKEPIDRIYAQIEDELRSQYSLGYTSDRGTEESFDYRHISVATKLPDLTVQAREGYYASQPIHAKGQ
jgi:VWFA-related protein